jgi:hypothetical protein
MTNQWTRPLSSHQRNTIVPILTLIVRVPPNPFIARPDSRISPMKSPMSSEMHAVHRLSMPIGFESVSNSTRLSFREVPLADMTMTAAIATVRKDLDLLLKR